LEEGVKDKKESCFVVVPRAESSWRESRKTDFASDADENGSQDPSSELSFIDGTVHKPPSAIQQTSESPESAEHVLLLLKNIDDVSLKKLGDDLWWSNNCEDKDGEDRRRSVFSRSVFGMETARGRRSVVLSEKDVLDVK